MTEALAWAKPRIDHPEELGFERWLAMRDAKS
jgi:hypothetical protein